MKHPWNEPAPPMEEPAIRAIFAKGAQAMRLHIDPDATFDRWLAEHDHRKARTRGKATG